VSNDTKYTKGPWILTEDEPYDGNKRYGIRQERHESLPGRAGYWIASMRMHWGNAQEANAKLIASAPELAEALQKIRRAVIECPDAFTACARIDVLAHAALKKAGL
jgi:hypothetical protein